jgi:hypothetical protein
LEAAFENIIDPVHIFENRGNNNIKILRTNPKDAELVPSKTKPN